MKSKSFKLIVVSILLLHSNLSFAACPTGTNLTGLSISQFLTSSDPYDDQRAEFQEAINCLISDDKYSELNLEGRQISISDSIIFPNQVLATPKKVVNGRVNLKDDFATQQEYKYAFSFQSAQELIVDFEFRNITIRAQGVGNGILLPSKYVNFVINGVIIDKPKTYGVRDNNFESNSRGHELRIVNSKFIGGRFTDQIKDRAICISIVSPDAKIQSNVLSYCRVGIELSNGAQLVQGNHIYSGYGVDQNTPSLEKHGTCLELNEGSESILISGNYLDQCSNRFNYAKNLIVTNNYFLVRASNRDNFSFIDLSASQISNTVISSNLVEDNHLDNPSNNTNFIKISNDIEIANRSSFVTSNNSFDNVINIATTNTVRTYPTSNQYHAYFDNEFPSGCKVRNDSVLSVKPKNLRSPTTWQIGYINTLENIVRIDVTDGFGTEYFEVSAYCKYD